MLLYLPASYNTGHKRYPVIYLQDGQNLFDPATAFGGKTWRAGEAMTLLAAAGMDAIVVAPYHMEAQRIEEYNPFAHWRRGRGAAYVEFVAETLKPIIDHDWRTVPDAGGTVIGGSSMGGLISLYAYCVRRDVFGGAMVMSPSLWVANGAIYGVVREQLVPGGRLYVDNGTREQRAAAGSPGRRKRIRRRRRPALCAGQGRPPHGRGVGPAPAACAALFAGVWERAHRIRLPRVVVWMYTKQCHSHKGD